MNNDMLRKALTKLLDAQRWNQDGPLYKLAVQEAEEVRANLATADQFPDATPVEVKDATFAAVHYKLPSSDIPALIAFERHRAEQAKIIGMPGLAVIPSFIAGFHAGGAAPSSEDSAAPAPIQSAELSLADFTKMEKHGVVSLIREKNTTIKAHQSVLADRDTEIAQMRAALAAPAQASSEPSAPLLWFDATPGSGDWIETEMYDGVKLINLAATTHKWGRSTTPLYVGAAQQEQAKPTDLHAALALMFDRYEAGVVVYEVSGGEMGGPALGQCVNLSADEEAHIIALLAAAPAQEAKPTEARELTDADIDWSRDLQTRLMNASQNIAENEDARQIMAEAACLLASLSHTETARHITPSKA